MSVPAAFLGVILIWSTTPLAIKWSGEGSGFLFGISARMVLGAVFCLLLMGLLSQPLPRDRRAVSAYLIAGVGMFGAFLATYWGAQFIPSGLVSVLFGLTPLVTGILAAQLLGEKLLTPGRLGGIFLGVCGLWLLFNDDIGALDSSRWAVAAVVLAVVLQALMVVAIKRVGAEVPAMALAGGGLLVAAPLFLLVWWLSDAALPQSVSLRTLGSIVYLSVVGSVLGFVLFYYALKRLEASRMALVTLITPVLALLLGAWLNSEQVSVHEWLASAVILSGLIVHQWADRLLVKVAAAE